MTNFNLREFLTENKLTALSKLSQEKSIQEASEVQTRESMLSSLGLSADVAEYLSDDEIRNLLEDTTQSEEQLSVTNEAPNVSNYIKMESSEEIIKELEKEVAQVTLEAKMKKLKEIIQVFETKINSLEEDSELEGFVNASKLKEMKRTTKKLRSMDEKYMKEYDKKYNKDLK